MIKVERELVSNIDVSLFFEKSMRGRIYYIAERYSKANNKYLNANNQTICTWMQMICM